MAARPRVEPRCYFLFCKEYCIFVRFHESWDGISRNWYQFDGNNAGKVLREVNPIYWFGQAMGRESSERFFLSAASLLSNRDRDTVLPRRVKWCMMPPSLDFTTQEKKNIDLDLRILLLGIVKDCQYSPVWDRNSCLIRKEGNRTMINPWVRRRQWTNLAAGLWRHMIKMYAPKRVSVLNEAIIVSTTATGMRRNRGGFKVRCTPSHTKHLYVFKRVEILERSNRSHALTASQKCIPLEHAVFFFLILNNFP